MSPFWVIQASTSPGIAWDAVATASRKLRSSSLGQLGCTPSKGDRCLAGLGVDFVDGKLEMLFGKVDQPGGFFVDSVKPGVTGASVFAEPLVS